MSGSKMQSFPLRPTLLVLGGDRDYEARSLGEKIARLYAEDMRRLTEKFSQRHWTIAVLDSTDDELLQKAWQSFEQANMAIVTGYAGSDQENAALSRIAQASNPIVTLVNTGKNNALRNVDPNLFHNALTLLPQGLEDQTEMTNRAVRTARNENVWAASKDAPSHDTAPEATGETRRLH